MTTTHQIVTIGRTVTVDGVELTTTPEVAITPVGDYSQITITLITENVKIDVDQLPDKARLSINNRHIPVGITQHNHHVTIEQDTDEQLARADRQMNQGHRYI